MSRKKIGNLFVVGYQGIEPADDFLKFVDEWGIGGIIVFARNIDRPENLARAIKRIEEAAGKKLFTAIDQEGGLVMRLLQDCSLFQSAMGLAATGDLSLIEASHAAMAKEMLALGLNWNLAPVLDINHPDNPGIGARSFGDTPQAVAKYGCAAIKGLQSAGVLACAKHFPGKGQARVDSHLTLPIIDHSREHLEKNELFPFKEAIAAEVAAIMTAHVFFPAFESTADLPATLSKSVLTGLLRDQLNYKGLLITDDLEMGAITEKYGIADAAARSFAAGADLLLICHQLEQQLAAAEKILAMVEQNSVFAQRLEESSARIVRAKRNLSADTVGIELKKLAANHEKLVLTSHRTSIRVLPDQKTMLPVNEREPVLFVIPKISALVQVEETHAEQGLEKLIKEYFHQAVTVEYNPKDKKEDILAAVKKLPTLPAKLVFFSYNAHLFKDQVEAGNHLARMFSHSAVFALRNPYDLKCLPDFAVRAASFSFRTPAIISILEALRGETELKTEPWPIDIKGW